MFIRTDQPINNQYDKIAPQIARFWDQISEGWREVWGSHIHHGFYENDEQLTPAIAQVKLIEKLASHLHIQPHQRILDVGCGMGGSSIYLAKHYHANVTGITLSQQQVNLATLSARKEGVSNVAFIKEDAHVLQPFADNTFDIVWSLESCEQFYDKALFLQQVYRVLKPNGKFMLATWCSSQELYASDEAKAYRKLCLAFDLPYMPTMDYYKKIIRNQHIVLQEVLDWSSYVSKSWDIGISLLNAYSLLRLLKLGGIRGLRFARQVKLMQKAFQQDRVKYGVFIGWADKPNT